MNCGSNLKKVMTKVERKKLQSSAMFNIMDCTALISLGNNMDQKTRDASAMLAMSAYMGKAHIHSVTECGTKMQ